MISGRHKLLALAILFAVGYSLFFTLGCGCCGGGGGADNFAMSTPDSPDINIPATNTPAAAPPRYAPRITTPIPNQEYNEDSGVHIISLAGIGSDAEDPPGNLSWSVTNADSRIMSIDILPDKTALIVLKADAFGSSSPVFILTDSDGMNTRQSVTINVRNVNDRPVITSRPVLDAFVNRTYSYPVRVREVDNDPVAYELTLQPRGMAINNQSGLITWAPDSRQLGSHIVKLRIRDLNVDNLGDLQEFSITVRQGASGSVQAQQDICFILASVDSRDQCYKNLAIVNNNRRYCSNVSIARQTECQAAVTESASALCQAIASSASRDYCHKNLAVQHADDAFCQRISDAAIKQQCLEALGG